MIGLEHPVLLWLLLPWLAFWLFFRRTQRRAFGWLERNLDDRFRLAWTRYSRRGLALHLLFLLLVGGLLIAGAAGLELTGRSLAVAQQGRVLLLLDGSASMLAEDVAALEEGGDAPKNRFELARRIALATVDHLSGWEFGLVSFSGVTTLHLPLVSDPAILHEALRTVEYHTYYQNSGSSFALALDAILPFVDPQLPDLQVVLLSDGEQPQPENFAAPLEALVQAGVPVHALAIGSEEGQGRIVWDYRDVIARKEDKRVLAEYHTRRVDRHLAEMASATGGFFAVASRPALEELWSRLDARRAGGVEIEDGQAKKDLAPLLCGIVGVLFLAEALVLGHRRTETGSSLDPSRWASSQASPRVLLLLLPLLVAGDVSCRGRVVEAHRENESGISADRAGLHGAAQVHFERSAAYDIDPEIPTFNRARSLSLADDWSEAHRVYQEALELRPDLARAHYNDGIVLFRWGLEERDPQLCRLQRTRDLWRQSLRRFRAARELFTDGSELAIANGDNARAVERALHELEGWIENPPEACRRQGGGGSERDGEGSQGDGGSGGGDPQLGRGDSPQSSSEDGAVPPPPSGGQQEPGSSEGETPPPAFGSSPPGAAGGDTSDEIPPAKAPEGRSGGLSPERLAAIRGELERIAAQAAEAGKYHRRTRPEQFGPEQWGAPDPVIWW